MDDFNFERLYQIYPRKEGRSAGMKKLSSLIKTESEYAAFAEAVDNYVQLCLEEKRERKYIMHWKTFVNNWTDYACVSRAALSGNEAQIERILRGDL